MAKHILSLTLQQQDSDGGVLARRVFSTTDDAPVAGDFRAGVLADTNQATLTLPTAQVRQLIFRNTHASAKITVVFTPFGGAEATINKVGPSGVLVLFDPTAAAAGIGVSSVKIQSDTNGGTYEMFFGG